MLTVSEGTVRAVLEKAHQQDPEDFVGDFLAQLRLENKQLHQLTDDFLRRLVSSVGPPAMDRDDLKKVASNEDLLDDLFDKGAERTAMAANARTMAAAMIGLVYKCVKAEIEAKELEY